MNLLNLLCDKTFHWKILIVSVSTSFSDGIEFPNIAPEVKYFRKYLVCFICLSTKLSQI